MKYMKEIKTDLNQWTVSRNTNHIQIQITFQHSVDNTECLESQYRKEYK